MKRNMILHFNCEVGNIIFVQTFTDLNLTVNHKEANRRSLHSPLCNWVTHIPARKVGFLRV